MRIQRNYCISKKNESSKDEHQGITFNKPDENNNDFAELTGFRLHLNIKEDVYIHELVISEYDSCYAFTILISR